MITVKLIQVTAWSYRSARHSLVDVALIELHHDQGSIELRRIHDEELDGEETLTEAAERWIIRFVLDIDAGRYRAASEHVRLPGPMVVVEPILYPPATKAENPYWLKRECPQTKKTSPSAKSRGGGRKRPK